MVLIKNHKEMKNKIQVSVIIVNYNGLKLTQDCINSLYAKTSGVSFEVIVVDNNSSDGSIEILSKDSRIKFIETGINLGFGKANNIGIKHSCGEYLFFLNNDTKLLNNAIKDFLEFSENTKIKIGALGCYLTGADGNVTHSFAKQPSPLMILMSYIVAPLSKSISRKIIGMDLMDNISTGEVGYVTGADLFIKREVIQECGSFDPDFFMYSEESEMQRRFLGKGYKNIIISSPKILHLEGMSSKESSIKKTSIKKIIMIQESLFLYVRKTSSIKSYYAFRFFFPFIRIPFIVFSKYTIKEKKEYIKMLIS